MGVRKHCDVCQRGADPGEQIVAFSLRYELFEPPRDDGKSRKHVSISAGAIDLCPKCWTRICKPKQRPKRRVAPLEIEDLFRATMGKPYLSPSSSRTSR